MFATGPPQVLDELREEIGNGSIEPDDSRIGPEPRFLPPGEAFGRPHDFVPYLSDWFVRVGLEHLFVAEGLARGRRQTSSGKGSRFAHESGSQHRVDPRFYSLE